MNTNKNYGLQKLPLDLNRFSLGKVVAYPKLNELPDTFEIEPLFVHDQQSSDFCAAFSGVSASEEQEGVELSPEYVFAMSKELTGDVEAWGQHLDAIAKTLVKVGAIEKKDAPYSVDNQTPEFLRNPKNWDEGLKIKALEHVKGSYMDCKGPYSAYDNLRAVAYLYRNEKKFPFLGMEWSYGTNEAYLEEPRGGYGHAIRMCGWRTVNGKRYLSIVNSYGKNAGDNGKFYLSEEIINTYVPIYGAEILTDITPEEYRSRLQSFGQSWIIRALKKIIEVLGLVAEKIPPPQIDTLIPFPVHVSKIPAWADAIEIMENAPVAWCNPGAIRGKDGQFLKFKTYQEGRVYLEDYLVRCCTGRHPAYPDGGDTTLIEFQNIYSPSYDGNNPRAYANFVANKLGVSIAIKIKELL